MKASPGSVEETGSGRAMAAILGAREKACQPGTPSANSPTLGTYPFKEPLLYCDSGMQGKASRSETRGLSEREVRVERGHNAAMRPIVH